MPTQTTFRVTVNNLKATDLPAMDVGGTSDPFVKVRARTEGGSRDSGAPPAAPAGARVS